MVENWEKKNKCTYQNHTPVLLAKKVLIVHTRIIVHLYFLEKKRINVHTQIRKYTLDFQEKKNKRTCTCIRNTIVLMKNH